MNINEAVKILGIQKQYEYAMTLSKYESALVPTSGSGSVTRPSARPFSTRLSGDTNPHTETPDLSTATFNAKKLPGQFFYDSPQGPWVPTGREAARRELLEAEWHLQKEHLERINTFVCYTRKATEMIREVNQRWSSLTGGLSLSEERYRGLLLEAYDIGMRRGQAMVLEVLAGDDAELRRTNEALDLLYAKVESLKKPGTIISDSDGYVEVDKSGHIVE